MNDPSRKTISGGEPQERLHESKDRAVDAAQNAAQKVRTVAEERYEEARGTMQARVNEARDVAGEKIAQVRDVAQDKIAEARAHAEHRAEEGVSTAASGLKTTAHRLREVADDMDGSERWLGATLEKAASTVDNAGDYLSGQNLNSIVGDAQGLARRNPAAFMGGAAALGFALARLGKATVERATADTSRPYARHDERSYDASRTAPTPAGLTTGSAAPAYAAPAATTRPTDGRSINAAQATPLHRSQT